MPRHAQTAHAERNQGEPKSPQEEHDRKQRVLTKGRASITHSIADAIVIKDGDLFFLSERDGNIPLRGGHGLGLYYHDCRFLNGYEIKLAGAALDTLSASAARGFMAIHQLTNPDIRMEGAGLIQKEEIGLKWERTIDTHALALLDLITVDNFSLQPISFQIELTFQTAFEDVYAVRGLLAEKLGTQRPPVWKGDALSFIYDGADGLARSLTVDCSPAPDETDGTTARFHLELKPKESRRLVVSLAVAESADAGHVEPKDGREPDPDRVQAALHRSADEWLGRQTEVRSESELLDRVLNRSLRDLRVLRSSLRGKEYFAAGVPWFVTLFGRDSLISALQTLAYEPEIAAQTLRLLASYQGQEVNQWKDEQPGKILHELRVGEMARLNEIPQTPYYGTVDATPLFLILLARHAAWTGDLSLFDELRANVELALVWIDDYGDSDGDGYVDYRSSSEKGLVNQGWKDSGDGIVNADGSLAQPPIALVEVQGYVYSAKLAIADLFRRAGETDRADQLRHQAEELRHRFNRDFWLKDDGFYALALQAEHRPAAVISSNPGQALWTGIVDENRAKQTVERLLAEDMFNGWGVRTLSHQARSYNPVGYHLGTVWPHDNSIIAAGFRHYGFDDAFRRVFAGIVQAATHFHTDRLPELFAGFGRAEYTIPVHYPVACHPQAWAAGSVPFMLETALGLTPEAFEHRLRIVRPLLPDISQYLELHRLRVGSAHADLRFERTGDGHVMVKVLKVDGDLEVVVDDGALKP